MFEWFGFFTRKDIDWDAPHTLEEVLEQYGSVTNYIKAVQPDAAGTWAPGQFARLQFAALRELANR